MLHRVVKAGGWRRARAAASVAKLSRDSGDQRCELPGESGRDCRFPGAERSGEVDHGEDHHRAAAAQRWPRAVRGQRHSCRSGRVARDVRLHPRRGAPVRVDVGDGVSAAGGQAARHARAADRGEGERDAAAAGAGVVAALAHDGVFERHAAARADGGGADARPQDAGLRRAAVGAGRAVVAAVSRPAA